MLAQMLGDPWMKEEREVVANNTRPPGISYKYCKTTCFVQTHIYTQEISSICCACLHTTMRISSGRQTTLGHQYIVIKYYVCTFRGSLAGCLSPRGTHLVKSRKENRNRKKTLLRLRLSECKKKRFWLVPEAVCP